MSNARTLALLALLLLLRPARADEPPRKPILRVEAGMHTALLQRSGVDAEGRFLVTGSEDKTARVWDIGTGRLLQVLRPPIGEGNEGKIYAVTISPDGKTVACGGWTGFAWDKSFAFYLFDRASGRLLRRVSGLPNVVHRLAYSPDGRLLAVLLGEKSGLRVYRTSDYSPLAADEAYAAGGYGLDFDRSGRLVTASLDGFLRLYDKPGGDKTISPRVKKAAPGGAQPYSVRFSPDGQRIAVGFTDTANVNVLSGKDLSLAYSPGASGGDQDSLSRVAWSANGEALYAGGRPRGAGDTRICKWTQGGRGEHVDLPAGKAAVVDIVPLPAGGIAFVTSDPTLGVFDAGDRRLWLQETSITDYGGARQVLAVSPDGATVQFGPASGGRSSARLRFSVSERLLEINPSEPGEPLPPRTTGGGLDVRDWRDTNAPRLNGRRLPLAPQETSRSLAVAPDEKSFLLGTEWNLRCFDRDGKELWRTPAPGVAWAVNVAGGGRIALAAFGDGTIRWYRLRDGRELCALFAHADRKRWVLWTPTGYYDASPGGEDLIGWHVNNGRDRAADFYPASRFRASYYRPDLTAHIPDTGDEAEALKLANQESGRKPQPPAAVEEALPPLVRILEPADGAAISSAQVTIRYEVRSPGGAPVTGVEALVDGRPAPVARRLQEVPAEGGDPGVRTLTVTVPARDCNVSILATNRFAPSEPATVRLRWAAATPTSRDAEDSVLKPRLYVLAIGVGKYADPDLALGLPAKDARDFAASLQRQKGGLYRDVAVKVLTDGQATKEAILDGLEWIQKETTARDVAMVFLSGHGANDPNGIYYFLPVGFNRERFKSTGVAFSDIKSTLEVIAGKALFFVDTCHSGNVLGTARSRGGAPDVAGLVNELASAENGCVVFASSTGRQISLEDPAWNNGAFTKALVEGLDGKADLQNKGRITVNLLDAYISERVKELTKGSQTPTTTKPSTIPDFPIAVRR